MIVEWYKGHNDSAPDEDMFTEESSYILENEKGEPWIGVSIYLTNCKGICFMEGTISNPYISNKGILKAIVEFNTFVCQMAKDKGYKRMVGMTGNANWKRCIKLTKELGYTETLQNASVFARVN